MIENPATITAARTAASSYLNEVQVAELLNLSKRTLQNWRLKGEGPKYVKFGRSVRYAVSTIEAWIAERERNSTSASSAPNLWGIPGINLLCDSGSGDRS